MNRRYLIAALIVVGIIVFYLSESRSPQPAQVRVIAGLICIYTIIIFAAFTRLLDLKKRIVAVTVLMIGMVIVGTVGAIGHDADALVTMRDYVPYIGVGILGTLMMIVPVLGATWIIDFALERLMRRNET